MASQIAKGMGGKLNRGMELGNQSTNANIVVEQGVFTLSKLVSVETE